MWRGPTRRWTPPSGYGRTFRNSCARRRIWRRAGRRPCAVWPRFPRSSARIAMQAFRFPLGRVLAWRRTELDLEESQLQRIAAGIEELAVAARRLDLARERAEQAVCHAPASAAADLWALAAYRERLLADGRALAERRRLAEQQLAAQQQRVMAA